MYHWKLLISCLWFQQRDQFHSWITSSFSKLFSFYKKTWQSHHVCTSHCVWRNRYICIFIYLIIKWLPHFFEWASQCWMNLFNLSKQLTKTLTKLLKSPNKARKLTKLAWTPSRKILASSISSFCLRGFCWWISPFLTSSLSEEMK